MRSWFSRVVLLLGIVAAVRIGAVEVTDASSQDFAAAAQAFHSGDYPRARKFFERARDSGMDTPTLRYNLGATYYRLHHYTEAEREFRVLLADGGTAPVANYNLGLIALQRGQKDAARTYFRLTRDAETTPQLHALAMAALARLDEPHAAARVQGMVSLSGGYDDNVALTPEADVAGVTDQGGSFAEAIAAARVQLSGSADDGLRLDAGGLLRNYQDLSAYNLQAGRLGLSRFMPMDDWAGMVGVNLDTAYLDGQRFQNLTTLTLQASRPLGQTRRLQLRYRASRIDGGDGYEYLNGWRQRIGAEISWHAQRRQWLLGYELELNDREDLRQGGEFFSQSPQRNSLYAELRMPVTTRVSLNARAEYRRSDYSGTDVHIVGPGTQSAARNDTAWQTTVRAVYRLDARWQAFAGITHSNNDSNFSSLSYRRNEAQAGVELRF